MSMSRVNNDDLSQRYFDRNFGYNMIDCAKYETGRNPETRNFVNLADELYNSGWKRRDLFTLMSQLYNVFEGFRDTHRCNDVDVATDYIEALHFPTNEMDEVYTPEAQTQESRVNFSLSPPPIPRLLRSQAVEFSFDGNDDNDEVETEQTTIEEYIDNIDIWDNGQQTRSQYNDISILQFGDI